MNTKVKVGIAAAIVAALVALIVLDQKTTPKDDLTTKPVSGSEAITVGGNSADAPARRLGEDEINTLLQNAQKQFGEKQSKPPAAGIKGSEEKNEKKIPSSTGEEYVILKGDTLDKIAAARLGSASHAAMILEANPGLKPTALQVGRMIRIPAKAEPAVARVDPFALPPADPAPVRKAEPALQGKVYTVQPGDTLSGISAKVFNTSRHYQKIYEANRDVIGDPNTLQVGLKLVMPDVPAKPVLANTGGPGAGVIATAGTKLVQISEGASLWKIAEKFAAEKQIGIPEMMKLIVAANPDKLKDESSLLRLGWQLIIPE